MFVKRIMVNGKPYELVALREGDLVPGAVVGQLLGRRVYRVLCEDGEDLILRNVRNDSLLEAMPAAEVRAEFGLVEGYPPAS